MSRDLLMCSGGVRVVHKDDVIRINGGHKRAWRVLQERGVAPFVRPFWPVLVSKQGQCLAVVGLRVSDDCLAQDGVWPVMMPWMDYVVSAEQ